MDNNELLNGHNLGDRPLRPGGRFVCETGLDEHSHNNGGETASLIDMPGDESISCFYSEGKEPYLEMTNG